MSTLYQSCVTVWLYSHSSNLKLREAHRLYLFNTAHIVTSDMIHNCYVPRQCFVHATGKLYFTSVCSVKVSHILDNVYPAFICNIDCKWNKCLVCVRDSNHKIVRDILSFQSPLIFPPIFVCIARKCAGKNEYAFRCH